MRNQDQNIPNEQAVNDERISQLLGSLKRVETPRDFGFRVKGRIAARRQMKGRRLWLPASAAVAAPLGLVLAVGGYFALTTVYSPVTVQAPQIAEVIPAALPLTDVVVPSAPIVARAETSDNSVNETDDAQYRPANHVIVSQPSVRRTNSSRVTSIGPGGGSYVEASRESREINALLGTRDVLAKIGADANLSGASWTVNSVRQNSSAERSGLKAGDVVEAVNDQPLNANTSFNGKFAGKTVRVRRDGKVVQIDLKH
jgi:membrane-associated protease RseP (regulator of RpoE activity)